MRFSKSNLKSALLDLLSQIFLLKISDVASLIFSFSIKKKPEKGNKKGRRKVTDEHSLLRVGNLKDEVTQKI